MLSSVEGERRALCPDLLGFGRSPWPDVEYTPEAHLAALSSALQPRIEGAVDLVGHSLGAILALELAAREPDKVRSITLLALPYYDDEEQARSYIRLELWGRWMLDRPALARASCGLICQRRRFWRHVLPPLLPRVPRPVVEDGMLHSYQSISSTLHRCIVEHRVDEAAREVRAAGRRVRLITGDDDLVTPVERARTFAARFDNAELEVVAGTGHASWSTHPAWAEPLLACGCGPGCPMFTLTARS